MAIDTRIEGNPESIRAAGRWLSGTVQPAVEAGTADVRRIRGEAEWGWGGPSGEAFGRRMGDGATKVDELAADATRVGTAFEDHAAELGTGLAGMARAREIAYAGGLDVVGDQIQDPGPPPVAPAALPAGATPDMVQAYQDGVAAQQAHERKAAAFADAGDEAARARRIVDTSVQRFLRLVGDEFRTKWWVHAADFGVNGVVGGAVAVRVQKLNMQASFLREQMDRSLWHYQQGGNRGGTGLRHVDDAQRLWQQADDATRTARSIGARFAGKVPLIGLGITAAGVGADVASGKPVGKSIFSGVVGAVAAGLVVAAFANPVGILAVGAVAAGMGAGVLAGIGADYAYDALPQGVRDGIESGISAMGDGIGDAASAVGSGAARLWDSIF